MDDKHESFRQMLRKGGVDGVPPGMHEEIMQKVRAVEDRRIYLRMVLTSVIRSITIVILLVLLINIFLLQIPTAGLVTVIAKIPEKLYAAGFWLSDHIYYVPAAIILVCLYPVWRLRIND